MTRRLVSSLILSGLLAACAPAIEPPGGQRVEVVATTSERPGNPAVTPDGRLFFTMHPVTRPTYRLMVAGPQGAVPYPDAERSRTLFDNPLGIRAGSDGTLYILDMGNRGGTTAHPSARPPRMILWDTHRNVLLREITIPQAAWGNNSWPQDFALDERRGMAFIADAARADLSVEAPPAIVALDLRTGAARRLLEGHETFQPAPIPAFTLRSGLLRASGAGGQDVTVRFGLDPIAADPVGEWIYYAPGNAFTIYRIRAADLADPVIGNAELSRRIESYRGKPASDGIVVDGGGNVYITDVLAGRVGVATADGYRVLAEDPRMIWPDGLALGPDGSLYAVISQIGRAPVVNEGRERAEPPFTVLRMRSLAVPAATASR